MYKIALTGKANTGKNTAAIIIQNNLAAYWGVNGHGYGSKLLAFADPIKEMVRIMFPFLKKKWLYGSSKLRSNVIEGALDAEGNPLTIRRALIDLGTKVGRGYKDSMWLDNFDHRFQKEVKKKTGVVIVTDVRFRNEFDFLKDQGFYMIRINRDTETKINHSSETNQESILDNEFHWVIDNNFGLQELTSVIEAEIVSDIKKHQG